MAEHSNATLSTDFSPSKGRSSSRQHSPQQQQQRSTTPTTRLTQIETKVSTLQKKNETNKLIISDYEAVINALSDENLQLKEMLQSREGFKSTESVDNFKLKRAVSTKSLELLSQLATFSKSLRQSPESPSKESLVLFGPQPFVYEEAAQYEQNMEEVLEGVVEDLKILIGVSEATEQKYVNLLNEKDSDLLRLRQDVVNLRSELESIRSKSLGMFKDSGHSKKVEEELQRALDTKDLQIKELQSENQKKNSDVEKLTASLDAYSVEIKQYKENMAKVQKELLENAKVLKSMKHSIAEKDNTISSLQRSVKMLEADIDAKRIANLDAKSIDVSFSMQREVSSLKDVINEKEREIRILTLQSKKQEELFKKAENVNKELMQKIDAQQEDFHSKEMQLKQSHSDELALLREKIATHEAELNSLKFKLKQAELSSSKSTTELELNYTRKIRDLEQIVESFKKQETVLELEIEKLSNEMKERTKMSMDTVKELQTELDATKDDLYSSQQKHELAKKDLKQCEEKLEASKRQHLEINNKYENMKKEITSISTKYAAIVEKSNQLMESRCLENVSSLLASYQSTKEEYDQRIGAAESLSSKVEEKLSNLENKATKLTDTLHLNKESIDSLNRERLALSSRVDLLASTNASSLDEKDAKIIELSENLEVFKSKIQESASIISNFVTYSSKVKECASSLANIERPSSPARFMGKPETVNLENINEGLLVLKELVSTREMNFDEAKMMVQDARTEMQSLVEVYRTKLSHMKNMISAKVKTYTGHYQSELRTVYSQNTALSERCNNLEAQLFQEEYSAEEESIMSKKAMMHSQEMIQYLLNNLLSEFTKKAKIFSVSILGKLKAFEYTIETLTGHKMKMIQSQVQKMRKESTDLVEENVLLAEKYDAEKERAKTLKNEKENLISEYEGKLNELEEIQFAFMNERSELEARLEDSLNVLQEERNTVAKLTSEVDKLSSELETSLKKEEELLLLVTDLENSQTSNKTELSNAIKEKEELQQKLSISEKELKASKKECEELHDITESIEKLLAEEKLQSDTYHAELDSTKTLLDERESTLKSLNETVSGLRSDLQTKLALIHELESKSAGLSAAQDDACRKHSEKEQFIVSLQERISELQTKITALEEENKTKSYELAQSEEILEGLKSKVSELDEKRVSLELDVEDLSAAKQLAVEELSMKIKALESDLDNASKALTETKTELDTSNKENMNLQQQVKDIEKEKALLNKDVELLKRDLNTETEALASEIKILNENVHEKEVQIKTLSSELHSVRVNLIESKVLIEEYAKSNRSLESTLEIYEQNLTLKAKEIESMTNNSAFSKNEFNNYLKLTYGTICDMLTTDLKTLESIPSDASDNLNMIQLHSMTKLLKQALCEKLELNGGELAILKVQLEEQKKSTEEKIQKIEILNEELQKYQGEYSSVRDQAEKGYSEMKQLLENNEALISDLETVNEDLRSSLSKAQQSILEKNQELTSLRLTNEKLLIQLEEVESGQEVLRKRIEKLENEQFEDLQQRASKVVSTRDAALQTRPDVKEKQCQTFINSVKSYSNATTQVTSSTDSAAQEEVVKLKKQLKKYELSRQFYKKKLHDVDQELMSNQDVIMRLEEKIATLSQAQSMRQSQENIHSRLNDNDKNLVDDHTAYGILANSHELKKNGKVVSEAQMKKIIQHYENRLGKLYKLVKKGDEAVGTTEKLFFGTRATENVL